jgi:hypothetical protein
MTDEHGKEHEDVMSSLLDLQRRLRGDSSTLGDAQTVVEAPTPTSEPSAPVGTIAQDVPPAHPDVVAVSEQDLTVFMTPTGSSDPEVEKERFAPVTQLPTSAVADDRVAALAGRLAQLEEDLSGVMGSIQSVREDVRADLASKVTALQADVDVRVSFLKADVSSQVAAEVTAEMTAKVQRLQAESHARMQQTFGERLYAVESRLVRELQEQREGFAGLMAQRYEGMVTTLRDAIHEAAGEAGSADASGSPDAGDAVTD